MCNKDKKVIIIDFGWAVKKGPGGTDSKYPDHPLSIRKNKAYNWTELEIMQWYNFTNDAFWMHETMSILNLLDHIALMKM